MLAITVGDHRYRALVIRVNLVQLFVKSRRAGQHECRQKGGEQCRANENARLHTSRRLSRNRKFLQLKSAELERLRVARVNLRSTLRQDLQTERPHQLRRRPGK